MNDQRQNTVKVLEAERVKLEAVSKAAFVAVDLGVLSALMDDLTEAARQVKHYAAEASKVSARTQTERQA